MKNTIILCLSLTISLYTVAQTRILFIGNSYTSNNNLPQLVKDVSMSTGDTVITDQSTIGGYSIQNHYGNVNSMNKVKAGNWDFVVVQEQSQLPAFSLIQVQSNFYPYALTMDYSIQANNDCARTVYFMTWGRKYGDTINCPNFPLVCTYKGMDNLLRERYRFVADSAHAILSPVGAVWRNIIDNHPSLNLYTSDESHPSIIGSYAAACTFYTVIFQKDPRQITFNSTLSSADADIVKAAVKRVVYDSLTFWNVDTALLSTSSTFQFITDTTAQFNGTVTHADTFYWDINGSLYSILNPVHTFNGPGTYFSEFIAIKGCDTSRTTKKIVIQPNGLEKLPLNPKFSIHPNPVNNLLYLEMEKEATVNLYDQIGKLILTYEAKSSEIIDVSHLKSGVYYISRGDVGMVKRLVKVE